MVDIDVNLNDKLVVGETSQLVIFLIIIFLLYKRVYVKKAEVWGMGNITLFKLLNILININDEEREIMSSHEMFSNIRNLIERDANYINLKDKEICVDQLKGLVASVGNEALDYLVGITATNKPVSNWLCLVLQKDYQSDNIKLAATLCALGNADDQYIETEGVNKLKLWIEQGIKKYHDLIDSGENITDLNMMADRIVHYVSLAQILCTFMIAKYGSEVGVGEHFGVNVYDVPTDLGNEKDETDFTPDIDGTESIKLFDHHLTMLQGIEELYATGKGDSYESRYLLGVLQAQGVIPDNLQGMEGATWDKVKVMLTKAFTAVRNGLTAMKENFFDKSIDEIADDLKAAADANKKALAAVSQKDAVLTDSAKAGITKLANNTGNDSIKSICGELSNVGGAGSVIDKLMVEFTKVYNETGDLEKQFNEVDKNLKDLESQVNNDVPADDDKEGISVKKTAITDKSRETKDGFTELKAKVSDQRKQVGAIAKAIKGITPSIFYVKKEGDDE